MLVLVAACGRFGFETPGSPGGDDAIDDALVDGSGPDDGGPRPDAAGPQVNQTTCTPPGTACAFPGGLPCSCWGTRSFTNAGIGESNGRLTISPNANTAGAQGSCLRSAVPFEAPGVIAEISAVVRGAQGLTAVQLGATPNVYTLSVRDGVLVMEDGDGTVASVGYDAVAMRWWRIRPVGAQVIYETAADGKTWTTRGTSNRPASASYEVRVIGGTIGPQSDPGTAQIEGINVCPP